MTSALLGLDISTTKALAPLTRARRKRSSHIICKLFMIGVAGRIPMIQEREGYCSTTGTNNTRGCHNILSRRMAGIMSVRRSQNLGTILIEKQAKNNT
jgi:hypothetical protein